MSWNSLDEVEKYDCINRKAVHDPPYTEVVRSVLIEMMRQKPEIFIMGQGVNDKGGMFGMTDGLSGIFGSERVFDTPIAETALTGIAVGAAMAGQHPIYFHNSPDFLYLAMDQIINHASKYHFMSGGQYSVPLIIWAVTGRGWGSAAQHSQSIHGLLMHVPGIKIVMPTTPYDAKGLLITALEDSNPILFLDHRWLHGQKESVPSKLYKIPFGKGTIRKNGKDITIVGLSAMIPESLRAAELLEQSGISAEIIDLRSIKPYDRKLIADSVRKTGRLLIADTGWECCGAASEIAAKAYEDAWKQLKAPVQIVALRDIPTPAAYNLEDEYYQNADDIYVKAMNLLR